MRNFAEVINRIGQNSAGSRFGAGSQKLSERPFRTGTCPGRVRFLFDVGQRWAEKELVMKKLISSRAFALGLAIGLSACADPYDPGQRAIGGGLFGAGTGAAIGGIAGGGRGAATGAVVGGALGAVGAAATTPSPGYYGDGYNGYGSSGPGYRRYGSYGPRYYGSGYNGYGFYGSQNFGSDYNGAGYDGAGYYGYGR